MIVEQADTADQEDFVRLVVARHPRIKADEVDWPFREADKIAHLRMQVARDDDGTLIGATLVVGAVFMPPTWDIVSTTVAAAHEGRGVGRALMAAAEGTWRDDTDQLRVMVYDDDPRSLAIAQHWGYELQTHGITSELSLADLPRPSLPDGVTLESAPDLVFADGEAVEQMLRASQTNPEARNGAVQTLAQLALPTPDATAVGIVVRVDGVPAGILVGSVRGDSFSIYYTGIDPRFRGRGLAVLVKQHAHLAAAAAGATSTRTTNEVTNAGIRRINAELGYVVQYGQYRLVRRL